jgi:radical SAM superfamily enzyme YgiQ (UPF0313 family)
MSTNCVILSGLVHSKETLVPVFKTAGPYRIATELREAGYTVQVIDISHLQDFNGMVKQILKKFIDKETLWIGFSLNFFWEIWGYPYFETEIEHLVYKKQNPDYDKNIKNFINFCRTLNPNIKFITGGVRLFDFSDFGFTHFQGHVDKEIVDFTNSLAQDKNFEPPSIIKNYEFKNFCNSRLHYTERDVFNGEKALPIEITRGCIFKCKFCSFPLNGKNKGDFIKDYSILYDEFVYNYEKFGVTHYMFSDDTYNDSVQKITDLHNKIFSRLPFKITFTSYIRLDLVHRFPETVDILRESGLKSAVCGVETLDPVAAKLIGKGTNPQLLVDFMHNLKEDKWKDILTHSGWIIGFPSETKQSILKFIKWIYSDENPFNENALHHLRLSPKEFKSRAFYLSDFDITFDQRGYEFKVDQNGKVYWSMKDKDLDEKWCRKIETLHNSMKESDKNQKRKNQRMGSFGYSQYINLGIPEEALLTKTSGDIWNDYDIFKMIKEYDTNYIKKLMALPPQ